MPGWANPGIRRGDAGLSPSHLQKPLCPRPDRRYLLGRPVQPPMAGRDDPRSVARAPYRIRTAVLPMTPRRDAAPAETQVAPASLRLLDRPAALAPARPVARTLRVASWNVHKCVGTDGRYDPDRTAAVIAELGADLVALQEVDRRFGRRTARLDAATLARETGLVPLKASDLPDGMGWHGNTILVRPGTDWRLSRFDLPGAEPRGALIAELMAPGTGHGVLRIVAAHLGLLRRCRARQAAFILDAVAQRSAMPTLLLGDLNEWRPTGARSSALSVLAPMFGPLRQGVPSFPSRLPLLALDRILGCQAAPVQAVAVHDTPLARVASDHLPLTARVALAPDVLATVAGRALPALAQAA